VQSDFQIEKQVQIERTPRVKQIEAVFDLQASEVATFKIKGELPSIDDAWNIGLIVGSSGSGKTTIAKEKYKDLVVDEYQWNNNKSIIDSFPKSVGIKEVGGILSSVGFSSPPSWLKPFSVLSNGEKFRTTMARAIIENKELFVIDEFTSVVDRTVAKIGSSAIEKTIRRRNQKFIALSCHFDIVQWLRPDWIFNTDTQTLTKESLRPRPEVNLKIFRVHRKAWEIFRRYHYLNHDLNKSSKCFVAFWNKIPVAFTAVLSFPHPKRSGWREHRTVCLPDYQGVGIGNTISNYVASLFSASKPYRSTTSNPAMILTRAKSEKWKMTEAQTIASPHTGSGVGFKQDHRPKSSFEYVGLRNFKDAKEFGLI